MDMTAPEIVQFKAKLPSDLHEWLQGHAIRNCSTVTAEIVRAIRATKDREENPPRKTRKRAPAGRSNRVR